MTNPSLRDIVYINENYNIVNHIYEVADYLDINKEYLSRLFVKHWRYN